MADGETESKDGVKKSDFRDELMSALQKSVDEERAKRHNLYQQEIATSAVTKGVVGVPGSQFQSLPDADSPFEEDQFTPQESGASSTAYRPFELVDATDTGGMKVRVVYSTLAGQPPTGFNSGDSPPFILAVTATTGIYGKVTINVAGAGDVTGREIIASATTPANNPDTGVYHVLIGTVAVVSGSITSAANARFGPVNVQVCRNIYAEGDDPKFFVSFTA